MLIRFKYSDSRTVVMGRWIDAGDQEHAGGALSDARRACWRCAERRTKSTLAVCRATHKEHTGGVPSDTQRARWRCAERRTQRAMSFASSKILSFASSKILSFASSKILNFAASTI